MDYSHAEIAALLPRFPAGDPELPPKKGCRSRDRKSGRDDEPRQVNPTWPGEQTYKIDFDGTTHNDVVNRQKRFCHTDLDDRIERTDDASLHEYVGLHGIDGNEYV